MEAHLESDRGRKAIFFEHINLFSLPFLLWYLRLDYFIFCIRVDPRIASLGFFRRGEAGGNVRVLHAGSCDWLSQIQAHNAVLRDLEGLYAGSMAADPLIRHMAALYRSESIGMAYRKILALPLFDLYRAGALIQCTAKMLEPGNPILFVPGDLAKHLPYPSLAEAIPGIKAGIRIPAWARLTLFLTAVGRKIFWMISLSLFPFWILLRIGVPSLHVTPREDLQVGIRVYRTDLRFFHKLRSMDFLLDGSRLHAGNCLFCIETPIGDDYRKAFADKGYRTADIPAIMRNADVYFLREMFMGKVLPLWVRTLIGSVFSTPPSIRLTLELMRNYLTWSAFLRRYDLKHYVAYNDTLPGDIARNVILQAGGTETWYYLHTCHNTDLFTPPGMEDLEGVEFSFLYFDHLAAWGRKSAHFYEIVPHWFGSIEYPGCFWSEHIRYMADHPGENDCLAHAHKAFLERTGSAPPKIIGVFDTTFGEDAPLRDRDMSAFLSGMLRLLDDFPDTGIILKGKAFREKQEILDEGVITLYESLRIHPRCFLSSWEDFDTSEAIAASDLVISACFTSTTVEALGGRKRAIYYDATERFRGTYYDRFPYILAHGYNELRDFVSHWLSESDEGEFARFLDQDVRVELEAGVDGKAITRFREWLSGHGPGSRRPGIERDG